MLTLLAGAALLGAANSPLTFEDPNGRPLEVRPPARGAVVLHFWATWCPSCLEDLRGLEAAEARCRDTVKVFAVNVGEKAAVVREFLQEQAISIVVVRDPKGGVWREVGGVGLPTNLYWSGGAATTDVGPKTEAQWKEKLTALGCDAEAAVRGTGGPSAAP